MGLGPCPLPQLRERAPLVHNVTNYVVMNSSANVLLSLGASPPMAHAPEELPEILGLSQALVLNIGTLDSGWQRAFETSLAEARRRRVPTVLDPVGAGATRFRTKSAEALLEAGGVRVLRGNASEIRALAGHASNTKGVDATEAVEAAHEAARWLSEKYGCVVCVSGATDFIVQDGRCAQIHNGSPLMTRVTGMGCAASAVIAAFLAVESDALLASAWGMACMGIAGEMAAAHSRGPGTFFPAFLDALAHLDEASLRECLRAEFP